MNARLTASQRGGGAQQTARTFAAAWLACTYHQGPCDRLPDATTAYAAALTAQQGQSLPTPAETAAHPTITSLRLARSCGNAAVAVVTYADGEGGRFQIHVNLVREPVGWQVFDVAEAQPHIPLPKPLSEGPEAC
jgi:hypothetical protein